MPAENLVTARIVSITDGDTFKVRIKGKKSIIRIACIDAPEMPGSSWAQKSKDALTGMLKPGSRINLLEHDVDRYGRIVAEVFKGKNKNIGMQLVKNGFAEVYGEYACQCDKNKLIRLERQAKRHEKGIWSEPSEDQSSGVNLVKARVVSITDGDTFKVRIKGKKSIIRIACIDAPEMPGNSWAQKSKDALTGMLKPGSRINLLEHDVDRYGRIVAEVFKGKNKNIGMQLVKNGFAEVYEEYACQCDKNKLIKLERQAKRHEKGIWSEPSENQSSGANVNSPDQYSESAIPEYHGSRVVTCSQLSNQGEALEWLGRGHAYLDGDKDGIPCESLPLF